MRYHLGAHSQNEGCKGLYGVGAGEDPSEGEGDSSAPAAFFFFAAVFFFFFAGDGVGETLAVAAPVDEVAVVPCCVQEIINAAPIKTGMNVKTDCFIITVRLEGRRMFGRPLKKQKQHSHGNKAQGAPLDRGRINARHTLKRISQCLERRDFDLGSIMELRENIETNVLVRIGNHSRHRGNAFFGKRIHDFGNVTRCCRIH